MNRNDVITALASNAGLAKRDAERALDGILAAITEALERGDDVRLTVLGRSRSPIVQQRRLATLGPARQSKSPVVGNRSSRRARA